MNELWLAYEGGGSKTRIVLATPGGDVIDSISASGASPLYITRRDYGKEMRAILKKIFRKVRTANGRVAVAGLAAPMDRDLVEDMLSEAFEGVHVIRTSETEVGLAWFDLPAGIVMVAGTGASCVARDESGNQVVSGGYGPQFSDEGSGYWIGREAIAAVIRAEQGRSNDTQLRERLLRFLGLERLWDIHDIESNRYGHVYPPKVAAFAEEVFEAARAGDTVADGILRAASKTLGKMIVSVAQRSTIQARPVPVVLTGGVFNAYPFIAGPLQGAMSQSRIKLKAFSPVPEPVRGVFKVLQRRLKGNS
ncbi:MAG: hypothetical protein HY706_05630 [Candidatus Hydrogenedentes bacterium]|nr:hypothetical protein [Candidatus Hydrogenedentota bacterium]